MTSEAKPELGGRSLAQRRFDEMLGEMIALFWQASLRFRELAALLRNTGHIPFDEINHYVEDQVFVLKENCHFLFREQKESISERTIEHVDLFDLLVGSIFHELMKVKECTYQLERYAPVYSKLAQRARRAKRAKEAVRQYEEDFVHVCGKIIRRARKGLHDSVESTDELFRDALDHLLILLGDFRESGLVARAVLLNAERIQKLFGKQGIRKVFKAMYGTEWIRGYLLAARDYLESGWHDEAKAQAQKVLELDPKNLDALQMVRSLGG